jgi:hypothetical protein
MACLAIQMFLLTLPISAKTPPDGCSGPDHWPTAMTFAGMKNAGLIDNDQIDFAKSKTVRLVSEKIGKDLYREVFLVTFARKDGQPSIETITISDSSSEECSVSTPQVFVVSKDLRKQMADPTRPK